ncbi:Ig-like domain-containing protein [uncultured Tenacibaculum sp.]|uniref:Ig-like domain-containing protein n=1 Tax=uncultured Tenacibaculum sp. TaxID=174713 RepID=UPI0026107BA5|nr:Ig-like domain-containing protein [uncultured Tenacibaculum sp.]
MKHLRLLLVLSVVLLQNCVQNDIVEDRIEEKLSFNTSLQELTIKGTFQYTTKYTNNVGEVQTPTIIWTSSNPDVITVSNSGLVTALKIGTSIITATAITTDGKAVSSENEITVVKAESKLEIDNLLQDITINTTHQYTTTYTNDLGEVETPQISWSSTNPAVLSVSSSGLITAIALGNATITASVTINGNIFSFEDVLTVVGVAERLTINNPITELNADTSQTHQYTTTYTDQTGQTQTPQITWSSSDTSIASISSTGIITAVSIGSVTITASVTLNGNTTTDQNTITITGSAPKEKTGTIKTTSSYPLSGTFTLKEIPNTNDLELIVNADYNASTALPGLYLYITNNPNSVGGAKEIQKVAVFNGAHTYIIKDTGIDDYNHLLYWCKPFSVKVGDAEIK